jgi:phenylpropionate dioxygenase-like ring-hydroxylating dioxygenase large terminal subunit
MLRPAAAASADTLQQPTSAAAAPEAPAAHIQPQQQESGSQFNWHHAWYPVAIVSQLDSARPTAIKLLGIDMVIWRDGSGK